LFTHSFYDEEERHVKCPNEDHTLHCIVNRPMLTGLNKNVIFEMFHQINKHQMKNFSFDFLLFYRITCTVGVLFLTWHHLHTTLLIPLSLSLSLLWWFSKCDLIVYFIKLKAINVTPLIQNTHTHTESTYWHTPHTRSLLIRWGRWQLHGWCWIYNPKTPSLCMCVWLRVCWCPALIV